MGKTVALVVYSMLSLTSAFAQAPFYQDKTITIIQGREPGALGDSRVRAVIPFLKKYIPGNPAIVSEFMPGAGGRKATNHIFSVARPDGLTIGNVGAGLVANAVLGEPGVQYDLDKLIYLGSPNSATHYVFLSKRELGLNTLEKLLGYSGLRIGGQTVGHDIYINGRLFGWILGVKEAKFIPGYGGTELDLALMQGEVDARAQTAAWLVHRNPDWLEKRLVDVHIGIEIPKGERHPRFANLPELESFAKSEKERQILALFRAIRLAGSPYILPPAHPRSWWKYSKRRSGRASRIQSSTRNLKSSQEMFPRRLCRKRWRSTFGKSLGRLRSSLCFTRSPAQGLSQSGNGQFSSRRSSMKVKSSNFCCGRLL